MIVRSGAKPPAASHFAMRIRIGGENKLKAATALVGQSGAAKRAIPDLLLAIECLKGNPIATLQTLGATLDFWTLASDLRSMHLHMSEARSIVAKCPIL
jgi:hypothetical protein